MVCFGLFGCAPSAWNLYHSATICHLRTPDKDCEPLYRKAMAADDSLPGLHASLASHLLLQGKVEAAAEEFRIENHYYPESGRAISIVTGNFVKAPSDSSLGIPK